MELGSPRTTNVIAALAFVMALVAFFADKKLDALWPFTLSYETEGLKCDASRCELSVWVKNHGWVAQREVRLELPDLREPYEWIFVNRGYKVLTDSSKKTIDLGILHPGSFRLVSLSYPKSIDANLFSKERLYVYSADSEATYGGPGDDEYALPKWWWYTVYGLMGWMALFAAVRIFERPKGRYVRLLYEQDRAAKRYLKSRTAISKIRGQIEAIPPEIIEAAEAGLEKSPRWARPRLRLGVRPNSEHSLPIALVSQSDKQFELPNHSSAFPSAATLGQPYVK